MKKLSITILFICLILFSNCYKDKFRELHPNIASNGNTCDTVSAISYSNQIVPIINSNCINCHSAGATPPDLSAYAGVQASAQTSLYSSVIWDGSVSQMPKNSSSKLSICDLTKLRKWIEAGSPNN